MISQSLMGRYLQDILAEPQDLGIFEELENSELDKYRIFNKCFKRR
jgi:hypothetical protein